MQKMLVAVALALAAGARHKKTHKHRFSVVVDAGSTGCRVYAYEVSRSGDVTMRKGPKVTPGLSSLLKASFSDIEDYFQPLVDFALSAVPEAQWAETSLKIYATAGMRLLKDGDAERLYERVYAAVKQRRSLKVRRSDVRTISGDDEAYYEALAVNYALGVSDASKRREEDFSHRGFVPLAGALDLGGASTQIAVPDSESDGAVVSASDFQVRSYLGFGVEVFAQRFLADDRRAATCRNGPGSFDACTSAIAAFLGISSTCRRQKNATRTTTRPPCEVHESSPDEIRTTTATIAAADAKHFRPGSGSSSSSSSSKEGGVSQQIRPETRFIGTSLYYYAWRSMVQMLRIAGNSTVADSIDRDWPRPSLDAVRRGARSICGASKDAISTLAATPSGQWDAFIGDERRRQTELPRRCFDLAYVDVLLSDVFGLADRQVTAAVSVGDVDLDWTLGVVLDDAPSDTPAAEESTWFGNRRDPNAVVLPVDATAAVFGIAVLACAGLLLALCSRVRSTPRGTKKCDDPWRRSFLYAPVAGSTTGPTSTTAAETKLKSSPWASKSRSRSWPKILPNNTPGGVAALNVGSLPA